MISYRGVFIFEEAMRFAALNSDPIFYDFFDRIGLIARRDGAVHVLSQQQRDFLLADAIGYFCNKVLSARPFGSKKIYPFPEGKLRILAELTAGMIPSHTDPDMLEAVLLQEKSAYLHQDILSLWFKNANSSKLFFGDCFDCIREMLRLCVASASEGGVARLTVEDFDTLLQQMLHHFCTNVLRHRRRLWTAAQGFETYRQARMAAHMALSLLPVDVETGALRATLQQEKEAYLCRRYRPKSFLDVPYGQFHKLVQTLPHLTSLDLSRSFIVQEEVQQLSHLTSLEVLSLSHVSHLTLSHLLAAPLSTTLRCLHLRGMRWTRLQLQDLLDHLPMLTSIELSHALMVETDVCKQLHHLQGSRGPHFVSIQGNIPQSLQRKMTYWQKHNDEIDEVPLQTLLHRFPYLHSLHLSQSRDLTDESMRLLPSFRHLREIDLSGCIYVTSIGLSHLCPLEHCKRLNVSYCVGIDDAALPALQKTQFVQQSHLRHLNLSGCDALSSQGLLQLQHLASLKSLQLSHLSSVTEAVLEPLATLLHLTELDLSHCNRLKSSALKKAEGSSRERQAPPSLLGFYALARCKRLKVLKLSHCAHVDDALLYPLRYAKRLRHLDVSGKGILLQGKILAQWTTVTTLNLSGLSHLQPTALAQLSQIHVLRSLLLNFCPALSPMGIRLLAKATQLESLHLEGMKAEVYDLTPLTTLKNLKELNIAHTPHLQDHHLHFLSHLNNLLDVDLRALQHVTSSIATVIETLPFVRLLQLSDFGSPSSHLKQSLESLHKKKPNLRVLYSHYYIVDEMQDGIKNE